MRHDDFKNYYYRLKKVRYVYIIENNYRYAFCVQLLIYLICENNDIYCKKEDIKDLYGISRNLLYKAMDREDEDTFKQIFNDISNALLEKNILNNLASPDIFKIGINIDMASILYWTDFHYAQRFVNNILKIYLDRYGIDRKEFHILLVHLLGEIVYSEDINLALKIYTQYSRKTKIILEQYQFLLEMQYKIFEKLIQLNRFDDAEIFLQDYYETGKKLKNLNTDIETSYQYLKMNTLFKKGKFEQVISNYEKYTYDLQPSHILYPVFCLKLSDAYLALDQYDDASYWVDNALNTYKVIPNDDDTFFRLLENKSFFTFLEGRYLDGIKKIKISLEGYKRMFGRQNENYVRALCKLFLYTPQTDIKEKYWLEIADLSHYLDITERAVLYNNLVSLNINLSNEYTNDYKRLSIIAKKAIELGDKTNLIHIHLLSRLNYLRCLVVQFDKYELYKEEINSIFKWIENYCMKKEKIHQNHEFLYCVCKLYYACGTKQWRKFKQIDQYIQTYILPIVSYELKKNYENIKVELAYYKGNIDEAISIQKKQIEIDLINIYNHVDMEKYIDNAYLFISLVSQYSDDYIAEVYQCILRIKYLYAHYFGNYLDNPNNREIGSDIVALETRLLYKSNLSDAERKDIEKELAILNDSIEYDYKTEKAYLLPNLEDIHIPDNACLIDYCFYCQSEYIDQDNNIKDSFNEERFAVHLLLPSKNQKKRELIRFEDIDVQKLLDYFSQLEDEEITDEEIEDICKELYNQLFGSIEKYVRNHEIIYISADYFLSHFAFENLSTVNERLFFNHIIIYVSSALDMRQDFHVSMKKPLILGNPSYSVNVDQNSYIENLPISGIEADVIANQLNTRSYLGKAANKDLLLSHLNSTILHISSHGYFKESNLEDYRFPLISSSVILTGYDDWVNDRKQVQYGNGIITAQEISLLTFESFDLVVLSACDSALGYLENTEFSRGLRWGFAFAGAKVTITSLNEINEAFTAIFMIIFYQKLKIFPVARALWETKQVCIDLDIKEIRKNKLFHKILKQEEKLRNVHYKDDDNPFLDNEIIFSFICQFNGGKL